MPQKNGGVSLALCLTLHLYSCAAPVNGRGRAKRAFFGPCNPRDNRINYEECLFGKSELLQLKPPSSLLPSELD